MLIALRVDPHVLVNTNLAVMRDLQRLCVVCSQKGRCEHELAKGTASEHFREFCPNAFTLDALLNNKIINPTLKWRVDLRMLRQIKAGRV